MTPLCESCGQEITRRPKEAPSAYARRRYCSHACFRAVCPSPALRSTTDPLLDDARAMKRQAPRLTVAECMAAFDAHERARLTPEGIKRAWQRVGV